MAERFGEVLKSMREAAGVSLRALAERTYYSKSEIARVESGQRPPTSGLVAAYDTALGTAPLLTTLLALDGEDHTMQRRALLATLTAATGAAGIAGVTAVAELIRHGLLDGAGEVEDWGQTVTEYSRRLVVDPSPAFGAALLGQVMLCKQQIVDAGPTAERLRAAALLGQLYGLWQGNQDKISEAHGWYRAAATLADRSGDTPARVFTRARTASRGIFEGYTLTETRDHAREALDISDRPSLGALEAHSALVHVHALAEDLPGGRRALAGMLDVADRLDDNSPDGPAARTISFVHYLESRCGSPRSADRIWEQAEPMLRPIPVWWREAQCYYGLSLVRRGDVAEGVRYALDAVAALPAPVRTVGVAVADLLRVVPAGYRSAELDELRAHAPTTPGPWVALAV
ncbi:helix-turn-helix domain-containing protein [Micromonospora craniellae]|uniref:XRE family transcriptional regulator n=1 Tax=Micromonospora craniellae TaxID=2294034 RepID=A0A372FQX2_9ACTN|nr:helix-turn-helix transcriptional regulator [Micromonospora craniellae]QOC93994.1 helix-turn-helix transcriptional regulator [Micromonospora craniellae]RFS40490.1 XRE family transcriptional regulator [Micromonospora craniellae]